MEIINLRETIKSALDVNLRYREMLFRRGYLLSDNKISNLKEYPFYGIWTEFSLGRFYLYVQEKQTVYIQKQGDLFSVIIGHAYNPFDMECDENELCISLLSAYQNRLPEYFDKVSELTGLHVVLLIDKEKIVACQDACGLTGCYFGKINEKIYITEHPQLVADICQLEMNSTVRQLIQTKCYNIGNRHLPGNITPYDDLKRLGGNTYLLFDNQAFSIHRFFPLSPHPEYVSSNEKEENIRRISDLIHNGIECCTKKWKRCTISLTGGTDSKTTLACANGLYDKFTYFSFSSKPQEMVDAEAAGRLCERLGLKHTLYVIPEDNDSFEDFELIKKILMHNTSYFKNLSDNEIRKYIYLHDLDSYDVELKSWASEVTRVFFQRKYKIDMPDKLNERHCSIFQTRFFGHPILMKWSDKKYREFLSEIGLKEPLFNYEHTDLFYWEIRMGCWGVSTISSQQLYHRITIPMNNRKILDLFLRMPHEDRMKDLVHKEIMKIENPEVFNANVEVPNLYFHGYRIMMEKLYFWYRTLFYRSKM